MNIPTYPEQLKKLIKEDPPKSTKGISPNEGRDDPIDTVVEAEQILESRIGPIDTQAEVKKFIDENPEPEDLPPPRP